MLGKIRLSKFRWHWLSLPFRMSKNNISQIKWSQVKSSQTKPNQIKSYTHIWETENGNKDNDQSIIEVIIIMINTVIYIDKKEVYELYKFK